MNNWKCPGFWWALPCHPPILQRWAAAKALYITLWHRINLWRSLVRSQTCTERCLPEHRRRGDAWSQLQLLLLPPFPRRNPLQHCPTRVCLDNAFLSEPPLCYIYLLSCLPNRQNNSQLESLTLVAWFPQQIMFRTAWEYLHLQQS